MTDLLAAARDRLDAMLTDLGRLVEIESPSRDAVALTRSAHEVAALLERHTGRPAELIDSEAGPHVLWRGGGEPRVLILGHHDTVFPAGTLEQRPFRVLEGRAMGPGVYDMKAGIVQAVHALALVDDPSTVEILFTSDEEVGSGTSRQLVEDRARGCGAVLVLEPSARGGALKTARKGTGTFEVVITGRAAHAGLEPERGVNALVEAAHQIPVIAALTRPELGTTVTPTLATAGIADNVVPDRCVITVDARAAQAEEKERVETAMAGLVPVLDGAAIEVTGGLRRPPMPASASQELMALARQVATDLGLGTLEAVEVGGGSDGNFTGALGIPTLDGLGAVGDGAHTPGEYVEVSTLPERTALIAGIITQLSR